MYMEFRQDNGEMITKESYKKETPVQKGASYGKQF